MKYSFQSGKHVLILFSLFSVFNATTLFALSPNEAPNVVNESTNTARTQKWLAELDQKSGSIEFQAKGHPSALRIIGKGAGPQGSFAVTSHSVTGTASFDLNSLDTGINMRDKHMKEKYLQVDKFPNAKLRITKMNLPSDPTTGKLSAENIPFEGTLSLHGVEKPITGIAQVESDSQKLKVGASFSLNVTDYGIEIPGFAGITIDNAVTVTIQSEGNLSPPRTP
jgi:polyisoprenoid-binding protein YceI